MATVDIRSDTQADRRLREIFAVIHLADRRLPEIFTVIHELIEDYWRYSH